MLSEHPGVVPASVSPIRHLTHRFIESPPTPNKYSPSLPLLMPPLWSPWTSLAAHSKVSDSACFQHRADTLSIIVRGFAESWGPGNLPGCVKVSMRKASRCLHKLRRRGRFSERLRPRLRTIAFCLRKPKDWPEEETNHKENYHEHMAIRHVKCQVGNICVAMCF